MQSVFRESDIIGRQGGEEFIVIFPETRPEDVHTACKRLSRYLKEHGQELPLLFTYSGGLALASTQVTEGRKSILNRADSALYRAKANGRNRVITATDTPG